MEMKKSYSPFGSTPLSVDEVLPDIQTGRAVYPDKDKEADASYMERINQYKHEGFHDVSEEDDSSGGGSSSGGGGTEPLIVQVVTNGDVNSLDKTWREINNAFPNVVLYNEASGGRFFKSLGITAVASSGSQFSVTVRGALADTEFYTNSEDGYPQIQSSN